MNVLFLIHRFPPAIGGAEKYFHDLAKGFVQEGHFVHVITTNILDVEGFWKSTGKVSNQTGGFEEGVFVERFPVKYLPFHQLLVRGLRRIPGLVDQYRYGLPNPLIPQISNRLNYLDMKPDLIVCGGLPYDIFIAEAIQLGRRNQIPVTVVPLTHIGESEATPLRRYYGNPYQITLLKQAEEVVVLTEIEREFWVDKGVFKNKIRVIPPIISIEEVTEGDAERFRQKYRLSNPIVFYLGMKAYDKGTVHLVQAIQHLWQEGIQASLVLAGDSLPQFRKWFDQLPEEVKNQIIFLEQINEEEKRDLLAAGDLLVMPSRTDSYGIVFLEAWANKKAVIGARAGGVPEVIQDQENGLLVEFGDIEALSGVIKELLTDEQKRVSLGHRGYDSLTQNSRQNAQHQFH